MHLVALAKHEAAPMPFSRISVMAGTGNVLAKPMEPISVQDTGKELLKARLQQDGYLLLRRFLYTSTVLKVQKCLSL